MSHSLNLQHLHILIKYHFVVSALEIQQQHFLFQVASSAHFIFNFYYELVSMAKRQKKEVSKCMQIANSFHLNDFLLFALSSAD